MIIKTLNTQFLFMKMSNNDSIIPNDKSHLNNPMMNSTIGVDKTHINHHNMMNSIIQNDKTYFNNQSQFENTDIRGNISYDNQNTEQNSEICYDQSYDKKNQSKINSSIGHDRSFQNNKEKQDNTIQEENSAQSFSDDDQFIQIQEQNFYSNANQEDVQTEKFLKRTNKGRLEIIKTKTGNEFQEDQIFKDNKGNTQEVIRNKQGIKTIFTDTNGDVQETFTKTKSKSLTENGENLSKSNLTSDKKQSENKTSKMNKIVPLSLIVCGAGGITASQVIAKKDKVKPENENTKI